MDEELRNRLDYLEREVVTQELRSRLNYLEGEVVALESIMAELVAALVSNRLVDADRIRRTINEYTAAFTVRQHDDLIMGTPGEHYFRGGIRVFEKVGEKLPS